jgi:predicted phosphate transport protein (TIGR00153 family)
VEKFDALAENAQRMERLEHEGDQITHDILARLHRRFINPIDREDIHLLASAIDDVMDFIEATTERFVICGVSRPNSHVKALARVILKQVEEIHQIMPQLRRLRENNILQHCIEINLLENEADRILRGAVAGLFTSPNDLVDLIKWREVYHLMETAADKSEDVANVIEGIVLKNG